MTALGPLQTCESLKGNITSIISVKVEVWIFEFWRVFILMKLFLAEWRVFRFSATISLNDLGCNASNESVHTPEKLGFLPKANWFDENLVMFFKTILALTDHAAATS